MKALDRIFVTLIFSMLMSSFQIDLGCIIRKYLFHSQRPIENTLFIIAGILIILNYRWVWKINMGGFKSE